MFDKDSFSKILTITSDAVKKNIFDSIKFFQSGNEYKGAIKFMDFTFTFQDLVNFIANNGNEVDLKEDITSMNTLLIEIMSAFQNENYVWVNDIFEYEFIPLIEQLKKHVN